MVSKPHPAAPQIYQKIIPSPHKDGGSVRQSVGLVWVINCDSLLAKDAACHSSSTTTGLSTKPRKSGCTARPLHSASPTSHCGQLAAETLIRIAWCLSVVRSQLSLAIYHSRSARLLQHDQVTTPAVFRSAALGLRQCPWVASILVQALVDQPSDHVAELKALGAHLWQLAVVTGALLGVIARCHALPTLLPAVLLDVVPSKHLLVAVFPLVDQAGCKEHTHD